VNSIAQAIEFFEKETINHIHEKEEKTSHLHIAMNIALKSMYKDTERSVCQGVNYANLCPCCSAKLTKETKRCGECGQLLKWGKK